MLAAAEADFEPDVVDAVEQRAQIGGRGRGQIEREPRQQRVEQRRLARPQRMALAPAEEGAGVDVSWSSLIACSIEAQTRMRRSNGRRMSPAMPRRIDAGSDYFRTRS